MKVLSGILFLTLSVVYLNARAENLTGNICQWALHGIGLSFQVLREAMPQEAIKDCVNDAAVGGLVLIPEGRKTGDDYDGVFQIYDHSGKILAECQSKTIRAMNQKEREMLWRFVFRSGRELPISERLQILRSSEFYQSFLKDHFSLECDLNPDVS